MPTSRAGVVLIGALVLYFFANQTQVGWLYVMVAVLVGAVLAAGLLSRSTLRTVSAARRVGEGGDLYENDQVQIGLTLHAGHSSSAQIRLTESCPIAAPDAPQREMNLYVPSLPRSSAVRFDFDVTVYKRGVYEFPELELESRAPFGFFRKSRIFDVPSPVLVYPELKPLTRFDLLDRQLAPQITRRTAGIGYEVMGLRPYRPGDSPRHVHWRSVARTGQLVSKEFADETQPGVTLALDLFSHPYTETESKHTPFEWAVKAAASIGDYAMRRGYPLTLAGNDDALPPPIGALSLYALLQYLARVQPVGDLPLAHALARAALQAFVVVVLPYPDPAIAAYLRDLHVQNVRVLAVVLDPASFPDSPDETDAHAASSLTSDLQSAGIDACLIRFGDDWVAQLQQAYHPAPLGVEAVP